MRAANLPTRHLPEGRANRGAPSALLRQSKAQARTAAKFSNRHVQQTTSAALNARGITWLGEKLWVYSSDIMLVIYGAEQYYGTTNKTW